MLAALPHLAVECIVQLMEPHTRGVSRHISTSFHDAVRAVERKGESTELTTKNVVADIEAGRNRAMVRWVIQQPGRTTVLSRRIAAALAGAGWLEELKDARAQGCQMELCSWVAAARAGQIDVLEWLLAEQGPEEGVIRGGGTLCRAAAEMGRLDVLRWAVSLGAEMSYSTATSAAAGGHIKLLDWAVRSGCPWDDQVCVQAGLGGHWGIIRWAADNGLIFNSVMERKRLASAVYSYFNSLPICSREQLVQVALTSDTVDEEGGPVWRVTESSEGVSEFRDAIAILKRDFNFQFSIWSAVRAASRAGNLEFLKWLLSQPRWRSYFIGPPRFEFQSEDEKGTEYKEGEKFDLLLLLVENRYHPSEHNRVEEETCFLPYVAAAKGGHIHILDWLHSSGASMRGFCQAAAKNGHLHVLQWAAKTAGDWISPRCWVEAATHGHLSILQWAEDSGYHLDFTIILDTAAHSGHVSVLKWVGERGLPVTTDTDNATVFSGRPAALQWEADTAIRRNEQYVSGRLQRLFERATVCSDTQVLAWLLQQDLCPAPHCGVTRAAAKTGHLDFLRRLRNQYSCPWDDSTTYCAAKHGHLNVLQWAVAQGCPYNLRDIRLAASGAGFRDLLRWVDAELRDE